MRSRDGPPRWIGWLLALLILLPGRAIAGPEEAELKAAFIEKFTRFVQWPDEHTPTSSDPFDVCVVGDSEVVDPLGVLVGRGIKGGPARLRAIEPAEVSGCRVVFVARTTKRNLETTLAATRGRPILTVADSAGYGRAGIMFNFYRSDQYVRFEVNREAIDSSGLRVSAKLLRLGLPVNAQPLSTLNAEGQR